MDKPSVVFFNRVYPPVRGASGRVLRDLARAFVRDGWDVTVVTTGRRAIRERDGAVRVVRVPGQGRTLLSAGLLWLRMLAMGLSLPRHDLVVTMTDPPLLVIAGQLIARFKKSRHMHWCQDLYPELLPALGFRMPELLMDVFKSLAYQALRSCDRVVVVGRCMARRMTQNGVVAKRVAVIPNWPDVELAGGRARRMRKRQGVGKLSGEIEAVKPFASLFRDREPRFRVLYAGNLGRAHPLDTILDAAAIVAEHGPDIEFVFVGDGPHFDRLAQERVKRGLDNVRFLPWQPASRLRELMESGDLHLITMAEKAAGLLVPCKLYSALAVGRPCILVGPENTETARVLSDFNAGSVVPQGFAARLADTILSYRHDSDFWFAAHEGALKAGQVFVPAESVKAWIDRARSVVGLPARQEPERQERKSA